MTASAPLVSIGLPVYNGGAFLAQTVDSILSQTFSDFELIISDNASTDGSREIGEAYARKDSRVQVVKSEVNCGASWNYKRVFELARGQYFRWNSADDLVAPDFLACCVEALDQNPGAILCYPKTTLIGSSGETLELYEDNLNLQDVSPVERYKEAVRRIGLTNVIYGLMRTDVLRRTRLMGAFPGADLVFVAELALFGKFYEIDRRLFFRRMHSGAHSNMEGMQGIQEFFDPRAKGKTFVPALKQHAEFLRSVAWGPLRFHEKLYLFVFILRNMISDRDYLIQEACYAVLHHRTPPRRAYRFRRSI